VDCESQLRSAYKPGPLTGRDISPWVFRLANATACSAVHQEEPAARRRHRRSVASSDGAAAGVHLPMFPNVRLSRLLPPYVISTIIRGTSTGYSWPGP
jgi:hypothetical protein